MTAFPPERRVQMLKQIILLFILIAFSAFFSGSEIAYSSVNRTRLKKSAESGSRPAKAASAILEHYDLSLTSLLIGNNVVNIFSSSVATMIAIALAGEAGTVYAALLMTVIILIFGEIVPKVVAKSANEQFAKAAAYPLLAIALITRPLAKLVELLLKRLEERWGTEIDPNEAVSAEELVTIIDTTEDEGVIDEDRGDMIKSAVEFPQVQVQEILTPRVNLIAVDANGSREEIIRTLFVSPNSRIIVYRDTIDSVIGILSVSKALKLLSADPDADPLSCIDQPFFVYKTLTLPEALDALREHAEHLAIVTDEFGGVMGIVTVEDIIEELIGDIWDETDRALEDFRRLGADLFVVSGEMNVYDLFEELDLDEKEIPENINTVNGFLIDHLGHFPQTGESADYGSFRFTVLRSDGLRADSISVSRIV